MITSEIEIKQFLPSTLDARESATKLASMIKSEDFNGKIVLDFSEIIFMSRSFADQFHKEIHVGEKPLDIMIKNADVCILDMLRAVSNTQNKRKTIKRDYQILSFNNLSKLEDFTFSW